MDKVKHPALRYHGGKFRLAPWVLSFLPAHHVYVEPFGGAAGALLQKRPSHGEVYNDIDGDIVNFFRVLRDPAALQRLLEGLVLTPYARAEFDMAWDATDDPVERARRTAVRAMMGFGSSGATKASTGFRIDSKRAWSTSQHVWAKYPDALQAVGRRLAGVLIENRPALDVIDQHDGPDTLFYVDPPYVHDTRKMGWSAAYRHEMNDAAHLQLIERLRRVEGMVVLSGYGSDLYDQQLGDWHSESTPARISAGRGTAVRIERIWMNPAAYAAWTGASSALPMKFPQLA